MRNRRYGVVHLERRRLTLQAITPEGEVIDRLTVTKRPWPR
jgi:hypothetical protein